MQLEKQDNINLNFINNYNYLITAKYASQEEVENFLLDYNNLQNKENLPEKLKEKVRECSKFLEDKNKIKNKN